MKITARLVLLFGICIGFIYAVFSFYVTGQYTGILKEEVRKSVDRIAEETSFHITSHLHDARELLEGAAIYFATRNPQQNDMKEALAKIVSTTELHVVGSAFAYNTDIRHESPYCWHEGDSLYFTDLAQLYDYWEQEWYTKVTEEEPFYWSKPYTDFGIPMITCSRRIHFADHTFKGVLTVDISLESLSRFLKRLGGEKAFAFILHEESGAIVSSVVREWGETAVTADSVYIRAIESSWNYSPQDSSGQLRKEHYYDAVNRKNYYMVFSHMPETNWTAGALFEEEKVFAELNGVISRSRWILLGGFILISFIIILLSKSITRPLRQLTDAARQIGEGNLSVEFPMNTKGKSEIAILSKTIQEMQDNLIRQIQLLETTISQKQRIESELNIAYEMQQAMLPSPDFPGKAHFDIYAGLKPAKEIGGDLYDFFMIDDRRLCLIVGDVAGKSVPAALYMAITSSYIRAMSHEDGSPANILARTNRQLCENNEICMFVTLFCGIIDITTGHCCFANAGHPSPFVISPSGTIRKIEEPPQPALGVFSPVNYRESETCIEPGEALVLYTDGITEALDTANDEFGEERLIGALEQSVEKSCEQTGLHIMRQVETFCAGATPSDDITLLIFKRNR